jgi:hypothetical protein
MKGDCRRSAKLGISFCTTSNFSRSWRRSCVTLEAYRPRNKSTWLLISRVGSAVNRIAFPEGCNYFVKGVSGSHDQCEVANASLP